MKDIGFSPVLYNGISNFWIYFPHLLGNRCDGQMRDEDENQWPSPLKSQALQWIHLLSPTFTTQAPKPLSYPHLSSSPPVDTLFYCLCVSLFQAPLPLSPDHATAYSLSPEGGELFQKRVDLQPTSRDVDAFPERTGVAELHHQLNVSCSENTHLR